MFHNFVSVTWFMIKYSFKIMFHTDDKELFYR